MKYVIVTGMSGSGKSNALKILEDIGYYCIDNLPVELLQKFVELMEMGDRNEQNVVLGIDIRSGKGLSKISSVLDGLSKQNIFFKVLFLDADDETLIKRYKETRRMHPLAKEGGIEAGILRERRELQSLRKRADYIVDTGHLLIRELRTELVAIFADEKKYKNLHIYIRSFGFAYGIPRDSDLLFDVRFLPNPFYDRELKLKTGEDKKVQEYVFSDGNAEIFLDKLDGMLQFLIPLYVQEGKNQLVISIGCTGGQHRSVAIARALSRRIAQNKSIGYKLEHRDCEQNIKRIK